MSESKLFAAYQRLCHWSETYGYGSQKAFADDLGIVLDHVKDDAVREYQEENGTAVKTMTRSATETALKILAVLPKDDPLYGVLVDFSNSVFLELPEANQHLWVRLQNSLNGRISNAMAPLPNCWEMVVDIAMGRKSS